MKRETTYLIILTSYALSAINANNTSLKVSALCNDKNTVVGYYIPVT